jgi:hypothetical protein
LGRATEFLRGPEPISSIEIRKIILQNQHSVSRDFRSASYSISVVASGIGAAPASSLDQREHDGAGSAPWSEPARPSAIVCMNLKDELRNLQNRP